MTPESDKIMFECYRDATYSRRYRVVYFTELDEHERDAEISAALAGEHFVSGFIRAADIVAARQVMRGLIERLNAGEALSPEAFEDALQSYSVV